MLLVGSSDSPEMNPSLLDFLLICFVCLHERHNYDEHASCILQAKIIMQIMIICDRTPSEPSNGVIKNL